MITVDQLFAFLITPFNVSLFMYYFFNCAKVRLESDRLSTYLWTLFRLTGSVAAINFLLLQFQFGLFRYGDHEGQLVLWFAVPVCFIFCASWYFAYAAKDEKPISYWRCLMIALIMYMAPVLLSVLISWI